MIVFLGVIEKKVNEGIWIQPCSLYIHSSLFSEAGSIPTDLQPFLYLGESTHHSS